MDFRFNLNEIFREPVVEIGNTLIPPKFTGDKRALWDIQSKVTQIVNAMGEASAAAQGLTKPITSADRLRNSEHKLYFLIDQSANNGKGSVTGMLKTGEKGLYVFDREGQHYQVSPPCILDFYVHESKQRTGYGKQLFEYMLAREQTDPVRMAIDRPSDKLLGFLNKHYGLNSPVKQMNNYVVFDGFFPRTAENSRTPVESDKSSPTKKQSANGLQHGGFPHSPYGRYAARNPPCSMNQIIHNQSAVIKRNQEPTGVRSEPITNLQAQQNYQYSVQNPWQTTQSVPNMPMQQYYYGQPQFDPQNYVMAQGDAPPNPPQNYYYPQQQYYTPSAPARKREPILPQSFDGTVRKAPHAAQSLPVNTSRQPVLVHSTPSAPVSYHNNAPVQQYGQTQVQQNSNQEYVQQIGSHQNGLQQNSNPGYVQPSQHNSNEGYMQQNLPQQNIEVGLQQNPGYLQQEVPQHNIHSGLVQNNQQYQQQDLPQQQVRFQSQEQVNNLAQQQQQQCPAQEYPNQVPPSSQPSQYYNQIPEESVVPLQQTQQNYAYNQNQHQTESQVREEVTSPRHQPPLHEPCQQMETPPPNQVTVNQIQQQSYVQNTSSSMAVTNQVHTTQSAANQQQPQQVVSPEQIPPVCPAQNVMPVAVPPSASMSIQQQQQNRFRGHVDNKTSGVCGQDDDSVAKLMVMQQRPNVGKQVAEHAESCPQAPPKQYDLSKGYPPQLHQQSAVPAGTPIIIRN